MVADIKVEMTDKYLIPLLLLDKFLMVLTDTNFHSIIDKL